MTIKERVMQILEYKGIAKENFFTQIGMTSANFRGNAKLTPLNSNAIANIFAIIPDLNLAWLITGNGQMTIPEERPIDNNFALEMIRDKDKKIEELIRDNERKEQELSELKKRYSTSTTVALPTTASTSTTIRK